VGFGRISASALIWTIRSGVITKHWRSRSYPWPTRVNDSPWRGRGAVRYRTTIGQFRLTVTPIALTTAWKTSVFPRGAAASTLSSPPIAAHHRWSFLG
jgi:hypothetical protein